MKNACNCLLFFQTSTEHNINGQSDINSSLRVLLSVFPPQRMERVVWLVISVCGASLLLDVLSAPHRDE